MEPVARTEKHLGNALRRFRKRRGLAQAELASAIQKRQATISTLENGVGATLETLFAVLSALQLELVVRARDPGRESDLGDIF